MSMYSERARLLFQQGRYEMAAAELRRQLVDEPDDADAHSWLGLSLNRLEKPKEALAEAVEGIRLAPERPFAHYAMAFILAHQDRHKQAEIAVGEALRLNPWEPDYFELLARIRLDQANWRGALDAADRGLALRGDHVGCTNVRGRALIKLRRTGEALLTVDTALRLEPDNASSHANKGWTLVESGDPKQALFHFREALRLDPNMVWARQGVVTALKAQNPIYRVVLGYFLWMARLPQGVRRGVIIGLWVAAQINHAVSENYPALSPYCEAFSILYVLFCYITWTADPIFNVFLRFNAFGRYALTRRQIVQSNWVAGFLLGAIAAFLVYLLRPQSGYLVLGIGGLAMVYIAAMITKIKEISPRIQSVILSVAASLLVVWAFSAGL